MQKAVEVVSRGLTLRGMLHIPEGVKGKVPAVIIFHGNTGTKTEAHFMFVKLSRFLEKAGFASIRFDFGGSGESDGDYVDVTISGELEDAKNILDFAKGLEQIDASRIGVIGLSMGGAVAGMLAGERPGDVRALCLWAPAGNMREIIKKRRTEEAERFLKENGWVDRGGLRMGAPFIEDLENLDIYAKSAPYDKNVLLIHGELDQTVVLGASEKYLELFETRAVLHVVEGADHTFNRIDWENEVFEYTLGFLEQELKG